MSFANLGLSCIICFVPYYNTGYFVYKEKLVLFMSCPHLSDNMCYCLSILQIYIFPFLRETTDIKHSNQKHLFKHLIKI